MKKDDVNHKTLLLEAAQTLMLSKGYSATTVDEICAAAGVTKGSFYHHFKSKEELGEALIDYFFEAVQTRLFTQDLGPLTDPKRRIETFFEIVAQALAEKFWERGCLMGSFAHNLSQTHPGMRVALSKRFAAITDVLTVEFERAQQTTTCSVPAEVLARQFVVAVEGGVILSKAHADFRYLEESIECYRLSVYALFGWD